jgi:hypothetical protein
MLARQEGLTKIYNRFHDPAETSADIIRLRELHVEMDSAVAAAYGWGDLALGHDFHETAQGIRYTISESARREVLSRLLKLNHERWEEEQLQGEKETGKQGNKKAKNQSDARSPKPKKLAESPAQYGLTMDIAPTGEPKETTPTAQIGKWDKCLCTLCDKRLFGFDLEEHTRSMHQGKDPGYRKL